MTLLTYAPRTVVGLTPEAVLDTFAIYQPKTARMVAEEFDIDPERAAELLDELARRKELTKTYGGTDTPVWLRRHPATIPAA